MTSTTTARRRPHQRRLRRDRRPRPACPRARRGALPPAVRPPHPGGGLRRPAHRARGGDEVARMLAALGLPVLDALVDAAVPGAHPHRPRPLDLPPAALRGRGARRAAGARRPQPVPTPMIGLGYYGTVTPPVIRRNVLENPAWYTAYTPYQPEISQGRLEALLNFQTMVADLTGLPTSRTRRCSTRRTAAAEAMTLMRRAAKAPAGRRVRRRRRRAAADDRRHRRPAPSRSASRSSSPT